MDNQSHIIEESKTGAKRHTWAGKEQILTISLAVFVTVCCCILFFFLIYRYNGLADFWKQLSAILQPITIGIVLAYLLNPVMKFMEFYVLRLLEPRMQSRRKAEKTARGIAIFGSLLFLVGVVVLLIAAIVPSMAASIQKMAVTLPEEVNNLVAWVEDFTKGDSELAAVVGDVVEKATAAWQQFLEKEVLPQAQRYAYSITSGVMYGVKFLLNIFIGLIVSVYVLSSKETFAGQAKKIVYAFLRPVHANVIIGTVRKTHEIFGGFISGKILDSAIIGVIAYVVLLIMRMPDPVLVAVIIGVTNVIPFFGPFVGAVPSFFIIVLQNPIQGVYFLIFIFVLQQVDGNIIGPKILGDSTGLSSFWVVFAIMMFGGLWGFPGMLLGVPLMAVIYYIARNVVTYFLRKRGLSAATEDYIHLVTIDEKTNEPRYGQGKKEG